MDRNTSNRSVNDLILVDDALNESMLNPELQKNEEKENINDQAIETDEAIEVENPRLELTDNNEGDT